MCFLGAGKAVRPGKCSPLPWSPRLRPPGPRSPVSTHGGALHDLRMCCPSPKAHNCVIKVLKIKVSGSERDMGTNTSSGHSLAGVTLCQSVEIWRRVNGSGWQDILYAKDSTSPSFTTIRLDLVSREALMIMTFSFSFLFFRFENNMFSFFPTKIC